LLMYFNCHLAGLVGVQCRVEYYHRGE
jgi:hypothetical protein